MSFIVTSAGDRIRVDRASLPVIAGFHWFVSDGYATAAVTVDGEVIRLRMHRYLMFSPTGAVVDHINGDTLDNRRSNLRVTNQTVNNRNRRSVIFLGRHADLEQAAAARRDAELRYFGERCPTTEAAA